MPDLPQVMSVHEMVRWRDQPVVCGGGTWKQTYIKECYVFSNNQWSELAQLTLAIDPGREGPTSKFRRRHKWADFFDFMYCLLHKHFER